MRDLPLGNGSLLVNFDDKYQIRDVYYPHVGQENHTEGFPFRFGVWTNGHISWTFEEGWERSLKYLPETLVTDVSLKNAELGIELVCRDTVASHENIFLRQVTLTNSGTVAREIRVFLHHDFRIYENKVGDTAFYDPENLALVHYKKNRYFLINTVPHFNEFSTGRKAFREHEGTWRDAEDGKLEGGAITEGSVDSTIAVHLTLDTGASSQFYYWIAAGSSHEEVGRLNRGILARGPEGCLLRTENYWRAWVNKNTRLPTELPTELTGLYKRSLLVARTQIDNGGAILAANDWDVTERATDHYSYLWTRDGAFVAAALDAAGYQEVTRRFFELSGRIVHPNGYFLQKYNPDGTVASGWHAAWDVFASRQLVPIQEDETALVLWAFWRHYERYRDIDFAHRLYEPMVIRCARFMLAFRDEQTGLPLPSWNLWEDRRGVHTFTCSTVVAGLRAAANFASLFGDAGIAASYRAAADEIVSAMSEHLYSDKLGRFVRGLLADNDDRLTPDGSLDASLFGLFYFGCFDVKDAKVTGTMEAVERVLTSTPSGGVARYENDSYMRAGPDGPGNPWIICTLWLAEYYIARAATIDDLRPALELLRWTAARAAPSGALPEQLDPHTGEALSVAPLTWSHSTFVATVQSYVEQVRNIRT